jgi:hypothetical protein
MKKQKRFWGFLLKGSLVILLPIIMALYVYWLYKTNVWYAPSMAVVLGGLGLTSIIGLIITMPKPKFSFALAPVLGFFVAYDSYDPSVQLLILFVHIRIELNECSKGPQRF